MRGEFFTINGNVNKTNGISKVAMLCNNAKKKRKTVLHWGTLRLFKGYPDSLKP